MTLRRPHWAFATAALALAGCGVLSGGGRGAAGNVTLHVSNENFHDATLVAMWEGQSVPLGTVTGNGSRMFTFTWQAQQLRIKIQLLAVGDYVTEPMIIDPGDELDLHIQPDLHRRITRRRGG